MGNRKRKSDLGLPPDKWWDPISKEYKPFVSKPERDRITGRLDHYMSNLKDGLN